MKETALGNPRVRMMLLIAGILGATLLGGWSIYTHHGKFLGLLALVTALMLGRGSFHDVYFATLACALASHVRWFETNPEVLRYKWESLFALGAISIFVAALSLRQPQWPRLIHLLVLLLVLLAWASVSWALEPELTFQKAGAFAVGLVCAFLGAWCWARDDERVQRLLDVHVDWLWLVYPISIVAYFGGVAGAYGGVGRFRSIFSNANALGAWSSLSLPLLFGMALTHPVEWRRKACVALFFMGGLCAYWSGSRGGVLGAALGMYVYCTLRWPRRTLSVSAVVAVAVTFLLAYEVDFKPVTSRMEHLIRAKSLTTLSERTVSWEMGLMIARQRPLLGHGFGLSDKAYTWYEVENPGSFYSLHNTYLDAYVGIGKVGVGLIVLILLLTYATGLRTYLRDRDGPRGLLALAVLCSVIGTTAHGAVENFFLSMGNPWSLPLWVGVAMTAKLAVLQRAALRNPEAEPVVDDGVVVPFPDAARVVTP